MITAVVGSGPGMGTAVARRFGREGSTLALVARRRESLDEQVAALAAEGLTAQGFTADVGDEASLRAAFAAVREALGDPDVLVYNASVMRTATPAELTTAVADEAFRVGTLGALVSLQEVLPAMLARGRGTVIATGGGTALRPWPPATALGMSKAALRNLVQSAATDLEGSGIHVATVTIAGTVGSPGFEPDTIAEHYWALHAQPPGSWETEIVHAG